MPHHDPARPAWRKSSHSGESTQCVEVADLGPAIGVRDSKNPDGPSLSLSPATFRGLVGRVRAGRLDG